VNPYINISILVYPGVEKRYIYLKRELFI